MKNVEENPIWPELSYEKGKDTYKTIHLWTQIIGKIKLAFMPWINHSWHITLRVSACGLSTDTLPAGNKHFQLDLDFLSHQLKITTSLNETRTFELQGLSVAGCYSKVIASLKELGIEVKINTIPSEMEAPTPLDKDEQNIYVPEVATNLHVALLNAHDILTEFRSRFIGKCSPVHFFWGSFDLAVSRFSGRSAPPHPGGIPNLPDWITREAYSHEVCSCGFWPGNDAIPFAAFYSYIYPEPDGYNSTMIKPSKAYYHKDFKEFILPYDDVRDSANPKATLMEFLQSTYRVAADIANWDRKSLERSSG